MGGPRLLAVSLVALLLLAGCAGGKKVAPVEVSQAAPTPTVSAEFGAVSGTVVDEEAVPLAGVQVGLLERLEASARTDDQGKFTFSDVPPGHYRVAAQKLGYESAAREVDVQAGVVSEIQLPLKAVPIATEPLIVLQEKKGYIACSVSVYYATNHCGEALGQDKAKFPFEVDAAQALQEAVFELVWTPGSAATGQELELDVCKQQDQSTNIVNCVVDTSDSSDSNESYFEYASGPSPQVLRLVNLPIKETTKFEADVGSGYLSPYPTLQQSFALYISLCYVEKCPDDYSAIAKN